MVEIQGILSDPKVVTCGVPQGSILGPLLFLCYINDMKCALKYKLVLYADDSCIFVSAKDPQFISDTLSSELFECNEWLSDNRLSLHVGKTECILFGTKHKLNKINDFSIMYKGRQIATSTKVKYLGLELDNCLTGESVVSSILKKTNNKLRFLYRYRNILNTDLRKLLCQALIQPHFDYACCSWFDGLSKSSQTKLQVSQNKMIRYILSLGNRVSVTASEFRQSGFLRVEQRVRQFRLNHSYKVINGLSPHYLQQHFTPISTVHGYRTRGSVANMVVPRVKHDAAKIFYKLQSMIGITYQHNCSYLIITTAG